MRYTYQSKGRCLSPTAISVFPFSSFFLSVYSPTATLARNGHSCLPSFPSLFPKLITRDYGLHVRFLLGVWWSFCWVTGDWHREQFNCGSLKLPEWRTSPASELRGWLCVSTMLPSGLAIVMVPLLTSGLEHDLRVSQEGNITRHVATIFQVGSHEGQNDFMGRKGKSGAIYTLLQHLWWAVVALEVGKMGSCLGPLIYRGFQIHMDFLVGSHLGAQGHNRCGMCPRAPPLSNVTPI